MNASSEFLRLLNHTFGLWRHERHFDAAGGWKEEPREIATFRGRLSGGRVGERLTGGKWPAHVELTLFALADLEVRRHDLIKGAGKILRVIGVREPSLLSHHLEIVVEEVDPGS